MASSGCAHRVVIMVSMADLPHTPQELLGAEGELGTGFVEYRAPAEESQEGRESSAKWPELSACKFLPIRDCRLHSTLPWTKSR